MAEAAAKSVLGTISRGHLECPICCCRFADPKLLDCLHSFCLNCLKELTSRQQPKANDITCPVCRRGTAVPDTGLQGLPNCFFLSSLVDEFNKQERLLGDAPADTRTCEQCDEGLEAVSRCLDCDGNICQKCLEMHRKMKCTKKHRIANLDQRGAEVPPAVGKKNDTPQCKRHTNQEICFYCVTCNILVCAKCVALDHRTAEHEHREVTDASRSYRQDVSEILRRFEDSREEFKVADDLLTHSRNRLRIMVARACEDVTTKEEEEIAKIRTKSRLLRDKVTRIGEERDRTFEEVQKSNRDKMERAEQIVATVNDLMQQADDFQLLDLKPKVMHNLEFQEKLKLEKAQLELSFIAVKCQDVVTDTDLGEVLQEEWQLKREFGEWGLENGQFMQASKVACLSNGDIAVLDTNKYKNQLMIFTSTGEHKVSTDGEILDNPWGVAATCDDLLLVTDGEHVKVFDSSLEFFRQFAPLQQERAGDSKHLFEIDVDKENRIAVGTASCISIHNLDGSWITTIPRGLHVYSLAVGINERLIFTSQWEHKLICTTYTGDEVFNIHPIIPSGLCCDDAGDIYLSNVGSDGSGGVVDHYSPEGIFIGRIIRGLKCPQGLTFTPGGDLVVAELKSIKIFQRVRTGCSPR